MKTLYLALSLIFAVTCVKSQDTTKVLFLGNSFTYFNNMPDLFKGLVDSAGIISKVEMYAPGGMYVYGSGTSGHDSSTVTESYIVSDDWDYIVIQDNQGGYVWSEGYISSMITDANVVLFNKIKDNNSCTRVIYFAGWAMEGGLPSQYWQNGGLNLTSDNTQDCIERIYKQYVYMNDSLFDEIVTPIGLAWNTCLNEYPSIDLFSSDGVHPSLSGSYLAASTVFSTVFKTDPTGINFDGGLNDTIAEYMRTTGYNTVITDSVYIATNLDEYTPEIEFNPDEISTPDTYTSYQWLLDNVTVSGATSNPFTISIAGNYSLIVTDVDGCWYKSFDLFCDPLSSSIVETGLSKYELYPNPAKDYVIISHEERENSVISLYNSKGKLFTKTIANGTSRLDLSDVKPGIYYIEISNLSSHIVKKIVITK